MGVMDTFVPLVKNKMNVIVLKKMKKGFILAAVACLAVLGANAQSKQVKVNVVLNPALSIEVNDGSLDQGQTGLAENGAVNLIYNTATDYTTGVNKQVNDHLKVTAVGTGYKVYAKASSNVLTRNGGDGDQAAATMAGEIVSVKVGTGSSFDVATLYSDRAANSGKGKDIFASGNSNSSASVVAQPLNVLYAARALNSTEVQNFLGKNNKTGARYTVDVVYDILAD